MKKIVILGCSGSIGKNALKVVRQFPDRLKIIGIAVLNNHCSALKTAVEFGVQHVAVVDETAAEKCARDLPPMVQLHKGSRGLEELAVLEEADIVLCAVVGMAGFKPVMAALGVGKTVALATKEVLVAAGELVMAKAAESKTRILPVDSEHSAIFQCIEGRRGEVNKIILTASGGPFALKPDVDFDKVTVSEALNHPSWRMGKKVTIDSATLMNKGLEVMEARWLFDMDAEKIDVVLHPESLIHSLVEFSDGALLAHLSHPDMRFPLQYAFTYPERWNGALPSLSLAKAGILRFAEPDTQRFPALALARQAAKTGGTMPAVLNAANEVAVQRFLDEDLKFSGIWRVVENVMNAHFSVQSPGIQEIEEADAWARRLARKEDKE